MTEKPDHFENIMKVFYSYVIQKKKNSNSKFQRGKEAIHESQDSAIKKIELLYNFQKCT